MSSYKTLPWKKEKTQKINLLKKIELNHNTREVAMANESDSTYLPW